MNNSTPVLAAAICLVAFGNMLGDSERRKLADRVGRLEAKIELLEARKSATTNQGYTVAFDRGDLE